MNQILDFTLYVALGDVSPVNNRLLLAAFWWKVGLHVYVAVQGDTYGITAHFFGQVSWTRIATRSAPISSS